MALKNDAALRERGNRVIPGGMYGHLSVYKHVPKNYPQYFSRAEGCRLWDVDGNEYIDFLCAFGPMIAGYGNPRIRAAADAQRDQMDTGGGPAPVMIDLAEHMVHQVSHADWALFGKNGNDATTVCNMVARAQNGKRKILVGSHAYHGAQPWCNHMSPGIPAEEQVHYPTFVYNDVESLTAAAKAVAGDLAGILVSTFKHDVGYPGELVDPAFARAVRQICDAEDAALIVDDVRGGLRLTLDASWTAHGVQVDLSGWGKAMGNGEPIAAILGSERYRDAAASIFATGSFWFQAAPMAAALETLQLLEELDAPKRMRAVGQLFRDGLEGQAKRHGHALQQSGPVEMPNLMFEDDDRQRSKGLSFCEHALNNGVYLNPYHNLFMSVAHTERDIDQALEATNRAFQALT